MQQGVQGVRKPPYSGPANHVVQVIRELGKLGHSVRMLGQWDGELWVSEGLADFKPLPTAQLDRKPLRLVEKAVRRLQHDLRLPYLNYFESLRFAQACTQVFQGFDILYERSSWMSYGSRMAARRLKIPLVIEQNGDHLLELEVKGMEPRGIQRQLSVFLMKGLLKSAARIIASGDGWRKNLIDRWGVEPGRVVTVENGTELVKLLQRNQLHSFQSGIDLSEPVALVYVGGFYPWHGITYLIRASARVIAQGSKVRLLLIGTGSGMAEAKELVAELKIEPNVTFLGHLPPEKYAPVLANADIGLSPYCGWREYSGLKILDYKASGLATISSGLNGMPATLKHESTGIIIPPCDEDALTEAITRLVSQVEMRRSMGKRARLEAEKCHGWEHTAQNLASIFSQLVPG
jgi:glycosyltransferase involved in cell wall biosynthesis